MKCVSLSLEKLREESRNWARSINKNYSPDLIIFVAKAGFIIGYEFSKEMKVPMIGIKTVRETGNNVKSIIAPVFRKLPDFIRNILISVELKLGVHERNNKRIADFLNMEEVKLYKYAKTILVVDDSIDTGASILAVKKCISQEFPEAEIKIAGLNVWDKSRSKVSIDFALYINTIIKSPMSKDSCDYHEFIKEYNNYQKEMCHE